jgi:gliding motility-associated-like protein
VFRKQKDDLLWSDIATLQPWEYVYNDNLNDIANLKDNLIYRVEAYEAPSHWEEAYTSSSQSVTYTREGDIWIPNAFTPHNDNNETFGPITTFTRQDNYLFQIYNRMGLMIFQTTDINQGWDGRFNGEYVPQGSYVYIIYCTFSDGTSHVQKGTVTVIR